MLPSSRAALLLSGDLAVLVLFAITGRRTHEEAVGLAAAGEVLLTAAPFLAGWILAATTSGALRQERTVAISSMATTNVMAWLLAAPLAMVLRALLLGRASPLSFYLVASVVPLVMLLAWRTSFVLAESRLSSPRRGV